MSEVPKLFLRFAASQQEPDFLGLFLENGGSIGAAATTWQTDFSLTGSKESVFRKLKRNATEEVIIPIPEGTYTVEEKTIKLLPSIRLNMSASRIGAAINGTLVSSIAGQGSEFLYYLIHGDGRHSQVGLVYSSWLQHSASVGMSGMQIFSDDVESGGRTVYTVQFAAAPDEEKTRAELIVAGNMVERYAEAAWKARQVIAYAPSPMLTKSVFKDPVGIAGKGYSLLHDIVQRDQAYSFETLDGLYKQAFKAVFADSGAGVDEKIAAFLADTVARGSTVAQKYGNAVAYATSLVVNYLVTYRSDGKNIVTVSGVDFAGAESWLRQAARTPVDANDCDGSALEAIGLLHDICDQEKVADGEMSKYKFLNGVRNTVDPYYQVCLAVVGATAAEATSAGEHSTIAGHAIALMLPSLSILRAMEKAGSMTIGPPSRKQRLVAKEDEEALASRRFEALFPPETVAKLPDEDQANLKTWSGTEEESVGARAFMTGDIEALAIEGTTPASPTLYNGDSAGRAILTKYVKKQEKAMAKVSPNVMRSIKVLHVGGSSSGSTHRFYRDIVEITFPRNHALWSNDSLRIRSAAASQYVLCRHIVDDEDHIKEAGATPKDIQLEEYLLVPLISVSAPAAELLDSASIVAQSDVVAPRPRQAMRLTPLQEGTYNESIQHLVDLKEHLDRQQDAEVEDGHDSATATYIVALSTLVHNPKGIAQFCTAIKRSAIGGTVTGMEGGDKIKSLVAGASGEDIAHFVVVGVKMPV